MGYGVFGVRKSNVAAATEYFGALSTLLEALGPSSRNIKRNPGYPVDRRTTRR